MKQGLQNIPDLVLLESLGYKIKVKDDWDSDFGAPCIILRDPETGLLLGGADPREES